VDRARVLIVDDDASMLPLMRHHLEADGHDVVAAEDGAVALRLALEQHFDLFLLDVMVPRISGFEDFDDATEGGATAHVNKPFDPIRLMELVREHIAARPEPA